MRKFYEKLAHDTVARTGGKLRGCREIWRKDRTIFAFRVSCTPKVLYLVFDIEEGTPPVSNWMTRTAFRRWLRKEKLTSRGSR